MKKLLSTLLVFVLLLSLAACGPAPSDPTETVANPFTQGSTTGPTDPLTTAGATDATGSTGKGKPVPPLLPSSNSYSFGGVDQIMDDVSAHYDYTGGELQLAFHFVSSFDYSQYGVGPLLFLDGIPQPYKTEEEPWYSYLHTYSPIPNRSDADDNVITLSFIPVTGQAGDALELYITPVCDPDGNLLKDLGEEAFYLLVQYGARDFCARVIFYETPPEPELPEIPDQVLSHSVTYEDEPRLRSWTPEDLQQKHAYSYTINGQTRPGSMTWYGFDQEPITLNFQIYGNSYVKYTLVCFKNYQPISVDPEDILYVEVKDGQRTEVEVQIDMSDFDGSAQVPFMVVLVPRNLQAYEDGTAAFWDHSGCRFEKIAFFYFGGEKE